MTASLNEIWLDVRGWIGLLGILLAILFAVTFVLARQRNRRTNRTEARHKKPSKSSQHQRTPHLNEKSDVPVNQDAPVSSWSQPARKEPQ